MKSLEAVKIIVSKSSGLFYVLCAVVASSQSAVFILYVFFLDLLLCDCKQLSVVFISEVVDPLE